jgi:NADPH-dependent 2,4-dienoyl-CoA reductase/sulfur reductase-like enzyme
VNTTNEFISGFPFSSHACDVAVIGGGPAGLAAAAAADRAGAGTVLIEREERLGGILKQCIHDGFGLIRFGEKLSGPEYSYRCIEALRETGVKVLANTFTVRSHRQGDGFELTLTGKKGMSRVETKTLVLATGCRERTAPQVAVHGTRPAGVLTAGAAQYYTNILGRLPCRRCVILGSGDIGLIMARRLHLEGAEVLGVYEAKSTPSGLTRNIAQCLDDFNIPLHVSRTVTRAFGRRRLEAVAIAQTDEAMRPIAGTEEVIECDGLILSVGLIPENELAENLGVELDSATKGPVCDQSYQTMVPGIFSCGNALQVNDLVDYVSKSGETAGLNAALLALGKSGGGERTMTELKAGRGFLCITPQRIDLGRPEGEIAVFFRSREERGKTLIRASAGSREIFSRQYNQIRPPEMEQIVLCGIELKQGEVLRFTMEDR